MRTRGYIAVDQGEIVQAREPEPRVEGLLICGCGQVATIADIETGCNFCVACFERVIL